MKFSEKNLPSFFGSLGLPDLIRCSSPDQIFFNSLPSYRTEIGTWLSISKYLAPFFASRRNFSPIVIKNEGLLQEKIFLYNFLFCIIISNCPTRPKSDGEFVSFAVEG